MAGVSFTKFTEYSFLNIVLDRKVREIADDNDIDISACTS